MEGGNEGRKEGRIEGRKYIKEGARKEMHLRAALAFVGGSVGVTVVVVGGDEGGGGGDDVSEWRRW
jgi:hypothetical protein